MAWVDANLKKIAQTEGECGYKEAAKLYSTAVATLCEIIEKKYKECGVALRRMWSGYTTLVRENVGRLSTKMKENESKIREIANSVVQKFELRVAECERKCSSIKINKESNESEMGDLAQKLKALQKENAALINANVKLKRENEDNARKIGEVTKTNKALRVIFEQATDELQGIASKHIFNREGA